MFGKYFVAALAVAAAALAQGVVNSPAVIIQCQPVQLSWTIPGTVFLSIIPGGQPSAAPIVDFGSQAASPYTWTPSLAAGTSITIRAINSDGLPFYSSPISIQAGSITNCAAASVSTGASSAAGSASSAVAAGSTSVASAVSSASVVASSGVSSASMAVSSAVVGASSAASSARASASAAVSSIAASASAAASSVRNSISAAGSSAANAASNSVTSAAAAATSTGAATKLQIGGVGAVVLGFIGVLAI